MADRAGDAAVPRGPEATERKNKMKRAIQVLALVALFAATTQAALPKNQVTLGFGAGPIPLCDPTVEQCKNVW